MGRGCGGNRHHLTTQACLVYTLFPGRRGPCRQQVGLKAVPAHWEGVKLCVNRATTPVGQCPVLAYCRGVKQDGRLMALDAQAVGRV